MFRIYQSLTFRATRPVPPLKIKKKMTRSFHTNAHQRVPHAGSLNHPP